MERVQAMLSKRFPPANLKVWLKYPTETAGFLTECQIVALEITNPFAMMAPDFMGRSIYLWVEPSDAADQVQVYSNGEVVRLSEDQLQEYVARIGAKYMPPWERRAVLKHITEGTTLGAN